MTATDWSRAQEQRVYHGSPDDVRDGFIHFSTAGQVAATLAKHFAGVADDLVLLRVTVSDIEPNLRWEASRGGALFPHLYGPLEIPAIEAVFALTRDGEGNFVLPPI